MRLYSFIFIAFLISFCTQKKIPKQHDEFFDGKDDTSEGFVAYSNPPADGFNQEDSDLLATLIADKVMIAMGGREAWDKARYFTWTFNKKRKHVWDKNTGNIYTHELKENVEIIMNIDSKKGIVKKEGVLIEGEVSQYIEKGYSYWMNDAYWLFMPFKLKDSGVTLKYMGEDTTALGEAADILQLTFSKVGVTPMNKYNVWVDIGSKLITQWAYYKDTLQKDPRFVNPWTDYSQYGDVLLSSGRGDICSLTDIQVLSISPIDWSMIDSLK